MAEQRLAARLLWGDMGVEGQADERLSLREAVKDFGWLPLLLLSVSGGLSIVDIIEKAIAHDLSFAIPFRAVLDSYHRLTALIGEIVEPQFQPIVAWLNRTFHWRLILHPLWRSLFILGMVLVAGLVRTEIRAKRWVLSILLSVSMGFGALAGALIVGLLRFAGGWFVQGFAASLPVALLFFSAGVASAIFQLSPPRRPAAAWRYFIQWSGFTIRYGLIAFVLGVVFSLVVGDAAGILVLGTMLALLGIGQLLWGLAHGNRDFTRTGLSVLGGFLAAGLIQVSNWVIMAVVH